MDAKKPQNFYIQYHNADDLQRYPSNVVDFEDLVELISLDNSPRHDSWINTRKKQVEKTIGDFCFLIVGKKEKKLKQYYLWSFFRIQNWVLDEYGFYDVSGTGFDFKKPHLLNNFPEFDSFREFCGRFGIGFQLINKHPFLSKLHDLAAKEMREIKTIFPPFDKSFQYIKNGSNSKNSEIQNNDFDAIRQKLKLLNEKMQLVSPQKRTAEIDLILRNDKSIVKELKKAAHNKCQYPNCMSEVLMSDGTNYVEVAHIKPVKEGGKSVIGNLLVLCPNHHKEFDYGNLEIQNQSEECISGVLNGVEFTINF